MPTTIQLSTAQGVARVALARPDVRNAFNAELIAELTQAFDAISSDPHVRVVILTGEGKSFCGGADVNWMRGALELSYDENLADAERMSDMFRAIDRCPKPVIGRIFGAALGGGAGLTAACDVAIAAADTVFGFTEVKLGIVPAVISPFVLAKIGVSHARALFLTGERFDAGRARAIGLVHETPAAADLDAAVDRIVAELRSAGPHAVSVAKAMIPQVAAAGEYDARTITTSTIAKQRVSEEGQEGLRAFLERRAASFSE
jgi:methylglutaconyl-CoA hydratase